MPSEWISVAMWFSDNEITIEEQMKDYKKTYKRPLSANKAGDSYG